MIPPDSTPGDGWELPDEGVRALARQWAARRDRGLSPLEQEEFNRWLQQSALHEIAWEEASQVWEGMDRLTVHRAIVYPGKPVSVRRWWLPALGAVAGTALVIGGWLALDRSGGKVADLPPPPPAARPEVKALPQSNPVAAPAVANSTRPQPRYASGANAALLEPAGRILQLSDGTRVYLKPGAKFEERFGQNYRRVDLLSGEALFDVSSSKDARLFVINAGDFAIGSVGISTSDGCVAVSVEADVIETRVITGQATVGPEAVARAASRAGLDTKGTITEAGLIARVQYPSTIDSETHVMPIGAAEFAHVMAWKRALEMALARTPVEAR